MTIAMQGEWRIKASKNASWDQQFRIEGSTNGLDGIYDETSQEIEVDGPQWGITVQHDPPGPDTWRQSRYQLANWRTSGGWFLFDIMTDDFGTHGGDEDFNDLILTCRVKVKPFDFVVYGQVKSYSEFCGYNPCFPSNYYVIDKAYQLSELLKYPYMRRILEKLYPERVKTFERLKLGPEPDPQPFRPMMIPSGLSEEPGLNVLYPVMPVETIDIKKRAKKEDDTAVYALTSNTTADSLLLAHEDLLELARLHDQIQVLPCVVKPVSQTILRFSEYDRSAVEKLGGSYKGEGDKHILGDTATDEFGNYVFRFSQDYSQLAQESGDFAQGESLITELRPDVIIELMETLPNGVLYATPPYYNIQNIKRINLCVPSSELDPPRTACQGGRAIQALGNLSIITTGTTLESDGTVTNTIGPGPKVDHAAWYGTVDLFACFLDTDPKVKHYVIRYRTQVNSVWSDWIFVSDEYRHPKQQGDGSWKYEKVGPDLVSLRLDGPSDPKVKVGAYNNIEDQIINSEWQNTKRDRKLHIRTSIYQVAAGAVEFKIEGFDASGEKVPGALDTIRMFIENTWSDGDIDYVKLGTEDPGECALLELPAVDSPLTVRYRVINNEGFLNKYSLNVYRGSDKDVATVNTATGIKEEALYQSASPYRFYGTSGYIEISLQPSPGGSWLPTNFVFCAFSFELTSTDRKTNGYGTPGGQTLHRELIGISHTPPTP